MGECGCGDPRPIARMSGPEPGLWYMLEVYPGCSGCGTDWALSVYRTREDDELLFQPWVPVVEFGQYDQWGVPILDTGILLSRFREEEVGEEDDEYESPSWALDDFLRRGSLRDVHFETVQKARGEATDG